MAFKIPDNIKVELWDQLSLLIDLLNLSDPPFYGDFGDQYHVPDTLFVGDKLYIRQYSSNENKHWVWSGKLTGHRLKICSTNELVGHNILSNELRNFIIKNIDLFEGI